MCIDNGIRPGAEAIAILHPSTSSLLDASIPLTYKILFTNSSTSGLNGTTTPTRYQCTTLDSKDAQSNHCELWIHKTGDLTTQVETPLHRIWISDGSEWKVLGQQLDLSVGGSGIMGRGISLHRQGQRVGCGIVGWGDS